MARLETESWYGSQPEVTPPAGWIQLPAPPYLQQCRQQLLYSHSLPPVAGLVRRQHQQAGVASTVLDDCGYGTCRKNNAPAKFHNSAVLCGSSQPPTAAVWIEEAADSWKHLVGSILSIPAWQTWCWRPAEAERTIGRGESQKVQSVRHAVATVDAGRAHPGTALSRAAPSAGCSCAAARETPVLLPPLHCQHPAAAAQQ